MRQVAARLCALLLLLYFVQWVSTPPAVNDLNGQFSAASQLATVKLTDRTLERWKLNRYGNTTVVVFKTFRLDRTKLDRLFRHVFRLFEITSDYHFCVMLDNSDRAGDERRIKEDRRYLLLDHRRFHMFSFDFYKVIHAYPELLFYLLFAKMKRGKNNNRVTGICCKRPPLWQLLRVPILLWQDEKMYNFKYTWMIEDDFDAFQNGKSALMDYIVLKDKQQRSRGVDVIGYRQNACPTWWHKLRHTQAFDTLYLARMRARGDTWTCIADYVQRLSQPYLTAHENAIRAYAFSFGETMVMPVCAANNLKIMYIYDFDWSGIRKVATKDRIAQSKQDPAQFFFSHLSD